MPLPVLEALLAGSPYLRQAPTTPQLRFLRLECLDALYGGAAGGGKSSALLMAALLFAEVPGYSALILRRTFADLKLPGALMDRAHEWLQGTGAKWNSQEHRWRFPSGSSLQFGYCEAEKDVYRYMSSEFQFVGLDEATQFTEFQLRYLFSRLRRRIEIPVPMRYRLASNPGGPGHEFIRRRYIREAGERAFVPAKVADNPHIDQAAYLKALDELPPVERARLKDGDWSATDSILFPAHALSRFVDARPAEVAARVRAWDKGYSAAGDWTVGVLMSKTAEGIFTVEDVVRVRCAPDERNRVIKATAEADDRAALGPLALKHPARRILQIIERPPGAGTETTASLIRLLAGHKAQAWRPVGDKEDRAETFSAQVLAGNVRLVRAPWNDDYIGELSMFPSGANDDQADASTCAFLSLAGKTPFGIHVL